MPLMECRSNGKPGFKFGEEGYCYTYDPDDERSKERAKQKAINQGIAMGEIEIDNPEVKRGDKLGVRVNRYDLVCPECGEAFAANEANPKCPNCGFHLEKD